MRGVAASLLLVLLAPAPPCQEATKPAIVPPADQALAANDKVLQRARQDLAKVAASLQGPHTFAGECTFVLARPGTIAPSTVPFRGAFAAGIDQYWCEDWHVLTDRKVALHRRSDGSFTEPQGDAPDCPLAPRDLAPLLTAGTVTSVRATAAGDRPAMQAYLVWEGAAAARVAALTKFPGWQQQRMLDSLEKRVRGGGQGMVVDASVVYDPASCVLRAVTLRLALPDARAAGGEEPPAHPHGLPPMAKPPLLLFEFHATVEAPAMVQLPEVSAEQRRQLGLPPVK